MGSRRRGVDLGRIGIWTSAVVRQPAVVIGQADVEIDGLRCRTPWEGEADRQRPLAKHGRYGPSSTGGLRHDPLVTPRGGECHR